MVGFIRKVTIAIASGIGVGSAYYVLGGVATPVFPSILPFNMAIVGFGCAFAIELAKAEEEKKEVTK